MHTNSGRIGRDRRRILSGILVRGTLPPLSALAPVLERVRYRVDDREEGAHDGVNEAPDENVNALDGLLGFKVRLHGLHGVLGEELAELELGIVQSPVAGDVPRNSLRLACIDEHFLPLDHELIVTKVCADDDVGALDEVSDLFLVVGFTLEEFNLWGRCQGRDDLLGVTAVASEGNIGVLDEFGSKQAATVKVILMG